MDVVPQTNVTTEIMDLLTKISEHVVTKIPKHVVTRKSELVVIS